MVNKGIGGQEAPIELQRFDTDVIAENTREASIPQTWVVGNVEHCVNELTSFVREYGITDLVTWAVPPGMRPEQMNGSLERFVRDVAPRVKAAAAAA